jgi:DNA topoisomerase-1
VARKKTTSAATETTPKARTTVRKKAPAKKDGAVSKTRKPAAATVEKKAAAPPSGKSLVIVESPGKIKAIEKYLGPGFTVRASFGHVRDLPKRKRKGEAIAGVNIEAGWVPSYALVERESTDGRGRKLRTAKEILAELKREADKAGRIFLATDPDREGEAIAWHIQDELKFDDARTFRVTFNEITRTAVQNAIAHPGKIDMDRVRAQEARRILDRVMGFPLSGLLRRKVTRGSTAGRVQSVALRLVVDREREIEAFRPEEFWKLTALLAPQGKVPFQFKPFSVVMAKVKKADQLARGASEGAEQAAAKTDKPEEKPETPATPEVPEGAFLAELAEWAGKKFAAATTQAATDLARVLDTAAYAITGIEQKDAAQKAPPPFITSTLQGEASGRLHFRVEHTMRIAQKLYEGVDLGSEGTVALITYMRTDSTRVSNDALQAVRNLIGTTYGQAYLPASPNVFKSGKSAQEAHEAIRPTELAYTPQRVDQLLPAGTERRQDLIRLYTLIYNRFVASQMAPAVFAVTNVEVTATPATPLPPVDGKPAVGLFKAQGRILKFDGWRRVLPPRKQEETTLPPLSNGQKLDRLDLTASQHFTVPPPRYNEKSLVEKLEKEGIGRPSTYATIIGKITSDKRGYIEVKERRFYATELGKTVTDLLVKHFPDMMDLKFTSHMEEDLDKIETRDCQYVEVLQEFWDPFSKALEKADEEMPKQRGVETGEKCPKCGRPMLKLYSATRKDWFEGCSGFKEKENPCKYIKPREGEPERPEPTVTEHKCPTCGRPMLLQQGKRGPFLGCSGFTDKENQCRTIMNFGPDGQPVLAARATEHVCDKCGKPMMLRQGKRGPFLGCTGYPKCRNIVDVDAEGNPKKPVDTGVKCEKCQAPMIIKTGFRGPFLACSAYPKCKSSKPITAELRERLKDHLPAAPAKKAGPEIEVSDKCPECGGPMAVRQARGNYFLGCKKYPKCKGTREATPELLDQIHAATAAAQS